MTLLMILFCCLLPRLPALESVRPYSCNEQNTKVKSSYRTCWTDVIPVGDARRQVPIVPFKNDSFLNNGHVLCFTSTIKVYYVAGSDTRRGCNVRYQGESQPIVWTAMIEAHSECAFMCIGYSKDYCDWRDDHSCLTFRTMKDTINSLDAVRVHERLIRADGDYYETFCGLSGYNMTLLLKQPGGASVANGFCQLYADGDTWMGAAWKVGPAKPADQDCSSSCEVNCYDVKTSPVKLVKDRCGVLISHSIHTDTVLQAPTAKGDYQCSLTYVNIQPTASANPFGCELTTETYGIPFWKVVVHNPSDAPRGSVECGVVCSCDSGTGGPYGCVSPKYDKGIPMTTLISGGEPLDTNYRYHHSSMSMASVLLVTAFSFAVLVWVFRFRRVQAPRRRPQHDM